MGVGDIRAAKGEGQVRGEVRALAKDIAEMSVEVRGPWSCVGEMRSGDPEMGDDEAQMRNDEAQMRSGDPEVGNKEA